MRAPQRGIAKAARVESENRADASLRRRTEPGRDVEEPKPELEEEEVEEEEEEEPPDVTLKAPAPVNMSMTLVRNSFKASVILLGFKYSVTFETACVRYTYTSHATPNR
ncbi:hypothetical protein ALC53_00252 [Atta colombica]|uniref:Uncharacterized protein n=1 Tax=Atta colombica TaxID=520822 RepID=A0A195BYD3_9HYME|nr:hypothetical protein ALC53_00252 [Atta colombica]